MEIVNRHAIPFCGLFVLTGAGPLGALFAAEGTVAQTTMPAERLPRVVQKFASPSGKYLLTVKAETAEQLPGDSGGPVAGFGSKSLCRLMHGDAVLWDKELPFVMSDVILTDQGQSVGVAFQHNPPESSDRTSHLLLVILDAKGERLLCEKHLRERSKKIFGSPVSPSYPDPIQIAVSPELERVVFWL